VAIVSNKDSNPKDVVGVRKAPLSCVPKTVVAELGVAMLEGASKYGRHNWREAGVRSSDRLDATTLPNPPCCVPCSCRSVSGSRSIRYSRNAVVRSVTAKQFGVSVDFTFRIRGDRLVTK
jgi:hypothetical protein